MDYKMNAPLVNKQQNVLIDRQKQSLHYSYETLFHLLSAAENFAGERNKQYEAYNISIAKSKEELKSEFAWELYCFQLALKTHKQKYDKYCYPQKLSREKIISDIERYITKVKDEKDKILFYAMRNIILEKKIDIDFDKLFDELDKYSQKEFNPQKLVNLIGPLNGILDKIGKNAENPNSDYIIRKSRSKSTEKLIEESTKNESICELVYLGKSGNLIKDIGSNEYFFKYDIYPSEFYKITIFNCINSSRKLYHCILPLQNQDAYLYFNEIKNNYDRTSCILFNKNEYTNVPSDYITIIDMQNRFGYIKNNEPIKEPILLINTNDFDNYK